MQIYIHIPFCTSKCPYCAFGSLANARGDLITSYFKALVFEIQHTLKSLTQKISTIFIGGGTPSSVSASFYEPIFTALKPRFNKNVEVTTEANPSSTSLSWLTQMRKFGVNRVSFGAQSFLPKKLKFLGRTHSVDDIFKAVEDAKHAGFRHINLDFIYGTKHDTRETLAAELRSLVSAKTDHISAYSLTIEEGTPFARRPHFANDDETLAKFVFDELAKFGYTQYEISNFARYGGKCRHNVGYWKGRKYIGFGAYAVGTLRGCFAGERCRFESPKNVADYIADPLAKSVEILTPQVVKDERMFLGLRSFVGVKRALLGHSECERAGVLVGEGLLCYDAKKATFYNTNYLLSDEIWLYIKGR